MQHSQNDYSVPRYFENASVISKKQMPIGSAKRTIFGNIRATLREFFQGFDLFFQVMDEARCGLRMVLGDVFPDFGDIRLGSRRDLNPVFFGHA